MRRVLIVESDELWLGRYFLELSGCDLRGAATLEEANDCWRKEGPFDCVVVAGQLSGTEPSTAPFVQMLRQGGFTGPIIAASNMPSNRQKLMEAGCSHAVANTKGDTFALVWQVLGS